MQRNDFKNLIALFTSHKHKKPYEKVNMELPVNIISRIITFISNEKQWSKRKGDQGFVKNSFKFETAIDLNKGLKQIKFPISPYTNVPIPEL